MTKAQEVRSRRLEKIQSDLTTEAKKIFDWILDLVDENTNTGHFLIPVKVCLFEGQSIIKDSSFNYDKEYDLSEILFKYNRFELFTALKEVIDQEEGYSATLDTDAIFWDAKAIILEVVIN